ncbi:YncE family protein [Polyangium aurulentum]|uniref:YncE family protein n=1 Tax=Polyangium aurulentum TaxID=2567896 RepID=UPI0010AE9C01|nr:hypothetical protein [Polyangium aurulentum]UQA57266.1 hypothetical protein E8A73_039200 [Polyangium aurulentum]
MKARRAIAFSTALAGATSVAAPAAAWDSICYQWKDPTAPVSGLVASEIVPQSRGCEGIEAARGRWRDVEKNLDEHRRIFELAVKKAGLPGSILETQHLAVLTGQSSTYVDGAKGKVPTVDVRTLGTAKRAVFRSFALDELAQLPDFSYSLWDWARGNETCPLAPLPDFDGAQACHVFATHMGATNSNHFPPQSHAWFDHYHGLAMTRADECRKTRAAVWDAEPVDRQAATDARFAAFFRACEVEALAYEAVAQHYLHDSWSAGHMWERWGSTDIDRFPEVEAEGSDFEDWYWNNKLDKRVRKLVVAEIVAVSAGTIHGSDGPLFEKHLLGMLPSITLHDPMCYPDGDVKATIGASPFQVVGDLHLHDVLDGPPSHSDISPGSPILPYDSSLLDYQEKKLIDCAAGSVAAVFDKLKDDAMRFKPVLGAAQSEPPSFDAAECRAPRATNVAMHRGIDDTDLQPVAGEALKAIVDIPDSVEAKARNDYGRLRKAARVLAKREPEGDEMSRLYLDKKYEAEFCDGNEGGRCTMVTYTAEPGLYTMLGVQPNRCYAPPDPNNPSPECTVPSPVALGDFVDPALPTALPPPDPNNTGGALALAFHASRASQLCDVVTASDLDNLPKGLDDAEGGLESAVACETCAEWIAPFLRVGKDASSYDTTAEPLCHFMWAAPKVLPPYVYEPAVDTADPMALARRHCGCRGLVAATDAGLKRIQANAMADSVEMSQIGATVPVGSLPRDVVAASGGRLLVSNGAGQIVGVLGDTEIDLDGDAANGITRLTFSGISDLQGIAVTNVAGKELLLAAAPGTGELIAYDLGTNAPCDRFSVAQVAGQGAYDVAVSADGTTVWVSLRKTSPLSGALASLSLPALAQCNGTAAATVQWLATPGAAAGLGPMALSPDGSKLAVGGRLATLCPDQISTASGVTDIQVGCDRVFVLDVTTKTWRTFGNNTSLPTRPGRYPYGVAWFEDGIRLAFASFQGIDAGGVGDSGWPASAGFEKLPIGGTLRIADTSVPSYEGGGPGGPRYWTYNMPLNGYVVGPSVVVDRGASGGSGWVFVGTTSGRISAYGVAPHLASADPMWEANAADPETQLHIATNGSWYGGCYHGCPLSGKCPDVCPGGDIDPPGFGSLELGSSVRVLAAY